MGKRKGKRKRERVLQLAGPGGGDFGPVGASACGRARFRPTWPSRAGRRRGTAPWRGPARQREGGADDVNVTEEGGARPGSGRRRAPRRFSAAGPILRRGGGGEARAGDGGHGVGRIGPAVASGGRSAARWRVPAAVMPPVRLPATIEWEKWRPVTMRVWRSFWHRLVGQRITRGGKGAHRGDEGSTAAQARMARGRRQWRWPELCGEDGLGRALL
jgi:hypothetical protein